MLKGKTLSLLVVKTMYVQHCTLQDCSQFSRILCVRWASITQDRWGRTNENAANVLSFASWGPVWALLGPQHHNYPCCSAALWIQLHSGGGDRGHDGKTISRHSQGNKQWEYSGHINTSPLWTPNHTGRWEMSRHNLNALPSSQISCTFVKLVPKQKGACEARAYF